MDCTLILIIARKHPAASAALDIWIARIERLTRLVQTEHLAGCVEVDRRMRCHCVDIAPVALQRMALVVRAAAARSLRKRDQASISASRRISSTTRQL